MDEYIKNLKEELIKLKKDNEYIEKCSAYAQALLDHGKPVFFDAAHVNLFLKMEGIKRNGYHYFNAGNRHKQRIIEAPSVNLKKRQKWIANNILSNEVFGDWIHGYVKGKSIVTNARVHAGKNRILHMDIKDFFQSITFEMVEKEFIKMGYSSSAAKALADICTFSAEMVWWQEEEYNNSALTKRYLPLGAPSSPWLSNLVFQNVDFQILNLLKDKKIQYTRYADDLMFSSDYDDLIWLKDEVEKLLSNHKFIINAGKTKLFTENDQKLLMGLNLTNGVKIQNSYKRKLRQEIYYCKKYGVESHLRKTGAINRSNFITYIYGKAYYVKMVEPALGEILLNELDRIFQDEGGH